MLPGIDSYAVASTEAAKAYRRLSACSPDSRLLVLVEFQGNTAVFNAGRFQEFYAGFCTDLDTTKGMERYRDAMNAEADKAEGK